MHGPEVEPDDGADAEGDDEAHGNAEDAGDGQVDPLLQAVEFPQHDHHVDEDYQEPCLKQSNENNHKIGLMITITTKKSFNATRYD